jgi:hypothetical protein
VLEPLADPGRFFRESARVIKDRGYFCIRTPNAWSYVALMAKLVPQRLHQSVIARAQEGRRPEDVFPAFYRANSVPRLRRLLRDHGFAAAVYGYEAEPSYLEFSRVAHALGVLHQRLAPGFIRPALFAFAEKIPASGRP